MIVAIRAATLLIATLGSMLQAVSALAEIANDKIAMHIRADILMAITDEGRFARVLSKLPRPA